MTSDPWGPPGQDKAGSRQSSRAVLPLTCGTTTPLAHASVAELPLILVCLGQRSCLLSGTVHELDRKRPPPQFASSPVRPGPVSLHTRWPTSPPLRRPRQPPATASRPRLALPLPCRGGRPCCRRSGPPQAPLLRGRGGERRRWPGPPRAPTKPVSVPSDEPGCRDSVLVHFFCWFCSGLFKHCSNLHQISEMCRGDSVETLQVSHAGWVSFRV